MTFMTFMFPPKYWICNFCTALAILIVKIPYPYVVPRITPNC